MNLVNLRRLSALMVVFGLGGVLACGGGNPGGPSGSGNNNNNTGQLPQLLVSYAGFVGSSLTTSDPTPCPTPACTIAAPTQIARSEGVFSHRVSAGSYRIDGTLTGRPGPLTGPAFNVSAYIAMGLNWQVVSSLTLLGIDRNSVRVNGNPIDPNVAGPSCGRFFESFTPSQVIQWTYTFTVVQYPITNRPDICI